MVINRDKGDVTRDTHGSCINMIQTQQYMCVACSGKTCKTTKCLCCQRHVPTTKANIYCNTDYDFSLFVVYTLLCNANVDEVEYFICNVCKATLMKATLMKATHEAQHVPRFAKHPIARAGANFLTGTTR